MQIRDLDRRNAAALALFADVAHAVYAADPVWSPASETIFVRHWAQHAARPDGVFSPFVASEDGRPLARAVAILTPDATDETGRRVGYIGFFDCAEDRPDAGRAVLDRCEAILADAGAQVIQLPKADNLLFGCQTAGFELPHVCLTPHNPPNYRALFEAAGYAVTNYVHALYFTRDKAPSVAFDLPGVTTRTFDRTRLDDEVARFHGLQRAVFAGRPGYVPRTLADDRAMIEALLPIIDDDLIIFAEDPGGETLGLLVCLPDFYQGLTGVPVDRARIVSIGILPDQVQSGIGTLLGVRLMQTLLRKTQYVFAEASLVLSHNMPPQKLADRFQARPGRQFVLLEKSISPAKP